MRTLAPAGRRVLSALQLLLECETHGGAEACGERGEELLFTTSRTAFVCQSQRDKLGTDPALAGDREVVLTRNPVLAQGCKSAPPALVALKPAASVVKLSSFLGCGSARPWAECCARGGRPRTSVVETWLILPVVICLSQRLSHACLSVNFYMVKLRMAH